MQHMHFTPQKLNLLATLSVKRRSPDFFAGLDGQPEVRLVRLLARLGLGVVFEPQVCLLEQAY